MAQQGFLCFKESMRLEAGPQVGEFLLNRARVNIDRAYRGQARFTRCEAASNYTFRKWSGLHTPIYFRSSSLHSD